VVLSRKPARGLGSTISSPSGVRGKAPAHKRLGAYLSQKKQKQLWWQQFLCIFIRINLNFCTNTRLLSSRYSVSLRAKHSVGSGGKAPGHGLVAATQVKSCVTDKHNTKYNTHTLISEQPYIHARWSIFTFLRQIEPRPGHRRSILGRLESLFVTAYLCDFRLYVKKNGIQSNRHTVNLSHRFFCD